MPKPNLLRPNSRSSHRLKPKARPHVLRKELQARLRRAEGQLRGLQRMVAGHAYCIDVLQQLSAVRRALDKFALIMIRDHLTTCVADALSGQRDHRGEKVEELIGALDRFLA
jgi:DNA-binding FrmR family transcriptional regulator